MPPNRTKFTPPTDVLYARERVCVCSRANAFRCNLHFYAGVQESFLSSAARLSVSVSSVSVSFSPKETRTALYRTSLRQFLFFCTPDTARRSESCRRLKVFLGDSSRAAGRGRVISRGARTRAEHAPTALSFWRPSPSPQ